MNLQKSKTKLFAGLMAVMLTASSVPMAMAADKYRRVYDPETGQYYYVEDRKSSGISLRNPVVKQAAIGAAVGAGAGALSDRSSIGRGLVIGGLVGAGTGLVDRSNTLADKPLLKSGLKGAAIGTGVSAITRRNTLTGAVVGAGAGVGLQYLKDRVIDNDDDW